MKRIALISMLFAASVVCADVLLQVEPGTVQRPGLKLGKPVDRPFDIDFRYSPPEWQTAICLPDDWQKTLVGRDGAMLYDFPGDFAGFGTRVTLSLGSGEQWVGQELENPRVPIVVTRTKRDGIELTTRALAVTDVKAWPTPPTQKFVARTVARGIEVVGTPTQMTGWARPSRPADPGFADVAVGMNSSLRYRFKASGSKPQTVAFGLCEGYWSQAGARVLELKIDGVKKATVDPVKDAGQNVPFVALVPATDTTGDGWIDIEVAAAPQASDKNTILNMLWVFDEAPKAEEVIKGAVTSKATGYLPCGGAAAPSSNPPRADLLCAELSNKGSASAQARPMLRVQSKKSIRFDADSMTVWIAQRPVIRVPAGSMAAASGDRELLVVIPPMDLEPGESRQLVIPFHHNADAIDWSQVQAEHALQAAREYWRKCDLPYGCISVPDANLQALLDGSIRNIYQSREIKDGLPAFQVGPTCYRGLWIVDGAFLLEAVTLLNRPADTRAGVEYMLKHQNANGSFDLLGQYWKETGIVLWVIDRHEQLTGDRKWLEGNWSRVERAVQFVQSLRRKASDDPKALHAGLVPPGFPDGGLGGPMSEYTNVYWSAIGLKSAIAMAERTGHADEAAAWQREYDDMWAVFRKAAERDMYTDSFGNRMLPVPMARPLEKAPHKALWAFCHAIYPGELFAPDDRLMLGTMASLTDNECEGLVKGTGWIDGGLWNYFGSFYGHAFAWLGQGQKAAQVLYAFGNHASPLLAWREEHMPKGEPHTICGDMPHNWASAEFIRLALHLLVFERGDELHLLEGLPASWLKPKTLAGKPPVAQPNTLAGKPPVAQQTQVAVRDMLTRFGPVSFTLKVAEDGRTADLEIVPPTRTPPSRIVLHTGDWAGRAKIAGREISNQGVSIEPGKPVRLTLELSR